MWAPIWPGAAGRRASRSRPITNGVHVADLDRRPTWSTLFDEHLGRDWRDAHDDPAFWDARPRRFPTRSCGGARRRCAATCSPSSASGPASAGRRSASAPRAGRRGGHAARSRRADDRLRAALHRLQAARADLPRSRAARAHPVNAPARPCRSSSPARRTRPTTSASTTCSGVYRRALDPTFGGRIAFVDDYDLHVAHFLVQGCDVWLNNPRKPLEASGTSGMKAAINGVPHLSIGDGWWAEGYNGANGWLIDGGRDARRPGGAGRGRRRRALPRCSRSEIVPAFYDRDAHGVPRALAAGRQGGDPDRHAALLRRGGW